MAGQLFGHLLPYLSIQYRTPEIGGPHSPKLHLNSQFHLLSPRKPSTYDLFDIPDHPPKCHSDSSSSGALVLGKARIAMAVCFFPSHQGTNMRSRAEFLLKSRIHIAN